jgi:hypothetical protein
MFHDLLWNPLLCLKCSVWFLRKYRNRKWETKTTPFRIHVYIKKRGRVYPGRPGSESTCRVDRVSPGQLPDGFLLRPGPVPGPGWPGPGLTGSRVDRVPGWPAGLVRVLKLWQQAFFFFFVICIFKFQFHLCRKRKEKTQSVIM